MVVLNDKEHREVVNKLCEVLLDKTKNNEIEWSKDSMRSLESSGIKSFIVPSTSKETLLLDMDMGAHKFEIMISHTSIGIEDTHIAIYDESVEGGFMICYSMGNKDSLYNLSDYLFGKYIRVDDDTSSTISDKLNKIMLDIGKDRFREERLSKLLDDGPKLKMKREGLLRRIYNKIRNNEK